MKSMSTTETKAVSGLAIRHYPGKWKQAQVLGKDRRYYTGQYKTYSYWGRVRLLFLELGDCMFINYRKFNKSNISSRFEMASRA
jgi:hypothetical protein